MEGYNRVTEDCNMVRGQREERGTFTPSLEFDAINLPNRCEMCGNGICCARTIDATKINTFGILRWKVGRRR